MLTINRIKTSDDITNIANCELTSSPFALFENESLNVIPTEYPISLYLCETDRLIIKLVNKYRILTSLLIVEALRKFSDCTETESFIENRIKLLVRADYLQISEIVCADGKVCSTRFYSMGYRGRGLVKALGCHRIASYIAQIADTPEWVKRIISCNQFLIRYGISYEEVEAGFVVAAQPRTAAGGDLVFRPTAFVKGEDTLFVESVRKSDNWLDNFDDKLGRMKKVVKNRNINCELHNPQLVVVCEDIEQMKQVFGYIAKKRLPFGVCCTCDALIYNSPENCLYALEKRTFLDILIHAA